MQSDQLEMPRKCLTVLTHTAMRAVAVVVVQTVPGVPVALASQAAVRSHNHQIHVKVAGGASFEGLGAHVPTSRAAEGALLLAALGGGTGLMLLGNGNVVIAAAAAACPGTGGDIHVGRVCCRHGGVLTTAPWSSGPAVVARCGGAVHNVHGLLAGVLAHVRAGACVLIPAGVAVWTAAPPGGKPGALVALFGFLGG